MNNWECVPPPRKLQRREYAALLLEARPVPSKRIRNDDVVESDISNLCIFSWGGKTGCPWPVCFDVPYQSEKMRSTIFIPSFRSVYKELHADHETGAADNK